MSDEYADIPGQSHVEFAFILHLTSYGNGDERHQRDITREVYRRLDLAFGQDRVTLADLTGVIIPRPPEHLYGTPNDYREDVGV